MSARTPTITLVQPRSTSLGPCPISHKEQRTLQQQRAGASRPFVPALLRKKIMGRCTRTASFSPAASFVQYSAMSSAALAALKPETQLQSALCGAGRVLKSECDGRRRFDQEINAVYGNTFQPLTASHTVTLFVTKYTPRSFRNRTVVISLPSESQTNRPVKSIRSSTLADSHS
jgi:hypothetical protein